MIKAEIFNQKIRLNTESVASDSVKHLKIKFFLDENWKDAVKTAVFENEVLATKSAVILEDGNPLYLGDNTCLVPFEVIKPPCFLVSLSGIRGDEVITSVPESIRVYQSGDITADEPDSYTPTQYQQLVDMFAETKEIAQSVRDDADNGLFKGEKGDDGITPIIDQVYNEQSENAQSGTAVAEGIGNSLGEISEVFGTLLEGSSTIPDSLVNKLTGNLSTALITYFENYINARISNLLGKKFNTKVITKSEAGSIYLEPNCIYGMLSEDSNGTITLFDQTNQTEVNFKGKYLGVITGNFGDLNSQNVLGIGGALNGLAIQRGTHIAINESFTGSVSWQGNSTLVIISNKEDTNE